MHISRIRSVAIVGDRNISYQEKEMVQDLSRKLTNLGVLVRSCGSLGVGEQVLLGYLASEKGASGKLRNYIPFNKFNGLEVNGDLVVGLESYGDDRCATAHRVAACHHRMLSASVMADGAKATMRKPKLNTLFRLAARGALMVLGGDKHEGNVDLVVVVGNTCGQLVCPYSGRQYCIDVKGDASIPVRVAASQGIPVLNVRNATDRNLMMKIVSDPSLFFNGAPNDPA